MKVCYLHSREIWPKCRAQEEEIMMDDIMETTLYLSNIYMQEER